MHPSGTAVVLLLVEDDATLADGGLDEFEAVTVEAVADVDAALDRLAASPDALAVVDVRDVAPRGVEALATAHPDLPVFVADRHQERVPIERRTAAIRRLYDAVPVQITRKDRENNLLVVNQAVVDLLGQPREEIEGRSAADLFPDHADAFHEMDRQVIETGEPIEGAMQELETPAGDTRVFETDVLPYEEDGAVVGVVVVAEDVTERTRSEAALRAERDVRAAVEEVLVTASDWGEVRRAVCRQVHGLDGVDLVWVGEPNGEETLVTGAWAGEGSYLDAAPSPTDRADPREPAVAAFADQATVSRPVDPRTAWGRAAADAGFEAAVATPIAHDAVRYGVLAAYGDADAVLDDATASVVAELAALLGYAALTFDRRDALLSDATTDVEFRFTCDDHYLGRLAAAADGRATEVGASPRPDGTVLTFVDVQSDEVEDAAAAAAEAGADVRHAAPVADGQVRLELLVPGPTTSVLAARTGTKVDAVQATVDVTRLRGRVANDTDLRSVVATLREHFPDATVAAVSRSATDPEAPAGPRTALDALTDRQREALEVAVTGGYFERPRDRSATELAASMGISRQTFLQHLRAAQRKVFEASLA